MSNTVKIKKFVTLLLRYMLPGVGSFVFDLALLWVFIEYLHVHYIFSTIVAFIIATTSNYFLLRQWVFRGTTRKVYEGYAYFLGFSLLGLVLTTGIMATFVEFLKINPISARILTATIVGLWNFSMNYFINFKMHKPNIENKSHDNLS